MKVLRRSESLLIIGERGITTRHWGIFMFLIGGGGFTALTIAGEDFSGIPLVMLIVAGTLGLVAAIFMGKVLRHKLDKITGILRLEHPINLNTKLDVEEYRISDIKSICPTKQSDNQSVLQMALTNSSDMPGGSIAYNGTGFSYILKDGKAVEAGIYSSITKEIDDIVIALSEFLSVPIE